MNQSDTAVKNFLVFQCYGHEGIFFECARALLSISQRHTAEEIQQFEIWIYTDNPEWFRQFSDCPLKLWFRTIDSDTIKKWKGSIDFVHRVKIEVLKDFCQTKQGNVIYADTDVEVTKSLIPMWKRIEAGKLYMHTYEGYVHHELNPIFKKLNVFLKTGNAPKYDGNLLNECMMWNAGVLGFHTNQQHILEQVLQFTDSVYTQFPKHIVEQFAFSVYFQKTGKLHTALPYFLHYWNLKEIRPVLKSFFEHFKGKEWESQVQLSGAIQMFDLMLQKNTFEREKTVMGKLGGKKWESPAYDWNYIESLL